MIESSRKYRKHYIHILDSVSQRLGCMGTAASPDPGCKLHRRWWVAGTHWKAHPDQRSPVKDRAGVFAADRAPRGARGSGPRNVTDWQGLHIILHKCGFLWIPMWQQYNLIKNSLGKISIRICGRQMVL